MNYSKPQTTFLSVSLSQFAADMLKLTKEGVLAEGSYPVGGVLMFSSDEVINYIEKNKYLDLFLDPKTKLNENKDDSFLICNDEPSPPKYCIYKRERGHYLSIEEYVSLKDAVKSKIEYWVFGLGLYFFDKFEKERRKNRFRNFIRGLKRPFTILARTILNREIVIMIETQMSDFITEMACISKRKSFLDQNYTRGGVLPFSLGEVMSYLQDVQRHVELLDSKEDLTGSNGGVFIVKHNEDSRSFYTLYERKNKKCISRANFSSLNAAIEAKLKRYATLYGFWFKDDYLNWLEKEKKQPFLVRIKGRFFRLINQTKANRI